MYKCCDGKAADDPHPRRQDARDSGLDVASCNHCDISAEVRIFNKKLKFKVLVSHRSGAVAALEDPKDVAEHTVRVGCDRLNEWRSGVCSLKGPNETAEITLLNTVDTSRTPRYSHDSLGHFESSIKEVEKQIRAFISHTWRADHQCDSDRHVAWTITQCSVNTEEQTSLFKWISKDYYGEGAKFAELSWFHRIAKQSNLAERWEDAHWVGKLKRADEQLFVIRSLTRSARAGRRQARVEKWNLGSVKALLNRIRELKTSTEIDTHKLPDRSTSRIKR